MNLLLASTLETTIAAAQLRFPKLLQDCYVMCIPTAANVYEERGWMEAELNAVSRAGAKLNLFDIAGKSAAEVSAELTKADVLYVTGGNCYYLLEQMRACHFVEALQPFFARGGVYMGASAGAVVACPRVDFVGEMDDPTVTSLTTFTALNLVPYLVMVHTDHRKYGPVAHRLMHEVPPTETIIGLTDSQALWITGNTLELIQA